MLAGCEVEVLTGCEVEVPLCCEVEVLTGCEVEVPLCCEGVVPIGEEVVVLTGFNTGPPAGVDVAGPFVTGVELSTGVDVELLIVIESKYMNTHYYVSDE